MKRHATAGVVILWVATLAGVIGRAPLDARAAAYPEGAPPGFSGGFGEQSCHACHFHAEPNAEGGKLTLTGVPERYTPGERYPITVTLARPGMKRAGFQLAARTKDTGAQAGVLAAGDADGARIGIDAEGGIHYANQRGLGTEVSATGATWSLVWTAPATNTPVVFDVAANAADGDGTAEGDYVYTASVVTSSPRF